jgi:hypothetical protein
MNAGLRDEFRGNKAQVGKPGLKARAGYCTQS